MIKRKKGLSYLLCGLLLTSSAVNPFSVLASSEKTQINQEVVKSNKSENDLTEIGSETETSPLESKINNSISKDEAKAADNKPTLLNAGNAVSNQSFELTSDITDVYNYSLGHSLNIGLSGKFTLDESQITNGQVVKIDDVTVTADIPGLEANLTNNVQTIIKNEEGERLGVLGVSSEGLTLTIDPTYNLKDGLESFTFTNITALKLHPTQAMIDANQNVKQTVQVGTGLLNVTYHEQTNYDITKLASNYTSLVLGSGETGYGQGFLYRVAFNQEGLTELQNSKGATATLSNLNKGDYLTAYTLSSNVVPQGNSFVVDAYLASEADNKLKTTRNDGSATPGSGISIKNISLPYDDLGSQLTLEQMEALVIKGVDKTYISKQEDGTYLILQNISEKTLTLTNEELSNSKNSPLSNIDPSGQATIDYYSQALENRATYAGVTLGFKYVDPTIVNTVKIEMLNPNTGDLMHTTTKDSTPQQVIPEGQARIKIHYVDESGNPLDTLTVSDGWPEEKYVANSKNFEGYSLDKEVTSIPGIVLTESDQIARSEEVTLDYPDAGKVTNLYYVYTKNPVVGGNVTAKYIDTNNNKISEDVVKYGNIGEEYSTEQKVIDGYTFKEVQGDPSGQFTNKAQTVTYVYSKNPVKAANVVAQYVDTEGKKISDDVLKSGNVGDKYTTVQKDIDGYTFKEMGKESATISGIFTDKTQTVTYVYTKNPVKAADVVAKYVDTEGNKISDDVVKSGNIGDDYSTEQKYIEGYAFKDVQGNPIGQFTDKTQTVTYVYTKKKVNPVKPNPDDNNPSHQEDTPKTESSLTHGVLPKTGENERMTWRSVETGLALLMVALIVSVFRFKRFKTINKN